ncbi:hypothetical protein CBF34_01800 [Vagococcus penaei]|uniref:Uncharacterized protein n=1 Tax=Vagococcus penaei TaxID=633807 RepID=A0A1Q2D7J8_9ENTE|nr:ATP-binding cassette domain-containing protein [Vagococcus penaei]AQP54368.1 hypothetical protein BW732_09110 [Vagococcus penaei]RSU06284.1 hypothetical protein CBF34_01800 [Vagococcus penaei]
MLTFSQVTKQFRHDQTIIQAVKDVSFQVNTGEVFGIVGESGSGKSTILKLINLMSKPDEGLILIKKKDVTKFSGTEIRQTKQQMGMIFQQFNLLHNVTVLDNVLLPMKLTKQVNVELARDWLDFVGLSDKLTAYPSQLSGGQQQRVAIARALIKDPELVLLDEATSALDEQATQDVIDILKKCQRTKQTTMVVVSHELDVIKSLCTRAIVLEKGRIVTETAVKSLPETAHQSQVTYPEKIREVLTR